MSKFNVGDQVISLINMENNKEGFHEVSRGYKGIIHKILPSGILTDYEVIFDNPEISYLMREEDLMPYPGNNIKVNNINILEYLSEDEIKRVCSEIWTNQAKERFKEVFDARSAAGNVSWCDLILAKAADNYTQKLLDDDQLRKQFNSSFASIMIDELEKSEATKEDEDLVREHIRWKLQNFADDFINDHKDELNEIVKTTVISVLKDLSVEKISEKLSIVLKENIELILKGGYKE